MAELQSRLGAWPAVGDVPHGTAPGSKASSPGGGEPVGQQTQRVGVTRPSHPRYPGGITEGQSPYGSSDRGEALGTHMVRT